MMADDYHHIHHPKQLFIFDRRLGDGDEKSIDVAHYPNFSDFHSTICALFNIDGAGKVEDFVIVTTERRIIDNDTYNSCLAHGDTLYLLSSSDQDLTAPVRERVQYLPHYDTLTKSGMYEYYASEGQNPLAFAFAELVDNALYATSTNLGPRKIEIRLMFEEASQNSVCVVDNGRGMNSKELNDWAVYRLSKHNRLQRRVTPENASDMYVPRALNSDISYFGVGGKQAIFFIGGATRMLSKCEDSNDVHEMILSKEDFKKKERNNEAIYSGCIFNRTVCDTNHIPFGDKNLRNLILEEEGERSFTKVYITNVEAQHVVYLKSHFMEWCRELAHIYHYYLHGAGGNTAASDCSYRNIDISVVLHERGKSPRELHLSSILDDMQTQCIRSAASTFDFKILHEGSTVEGQLRYHPFLYDRETFPVTVHDCTNPEANAGLDEEDIIEDGKAPRGDRPIFQCFWNGRLIPYTTIKSFDWCARPQKRTAIPLVCYNRISGALWANDAFKVSTNKLTFMDLEIKLNERSANFIHIIRGQDQRIPIAKAFQEWLKHCHASYDKQIRFFDMCGPATRTDLSAKKNQSSWTVFHGIEWHGNTYRKGDFVRTVRTNPVVVGSINRFFLHGDHKTREVYATGGEVEIIQEPSAIYGEKKIFPLEKLDKNFEPHEVNRIIELEKKRLPSILFIEWPEGNEIKENIGHPAGEPFGPLKVDILNGRGESCRKIPGTQGKRLSVELKVTKTSGKKKGEIVVNHTCQHSGKTWPYWFHKMDNVTALGDYELSLKAVVQDSSASKTIRQLPETKIPFHITVGLPWNFHILPLDDVVRSGVPFQLKLQILDYYDNIVEPSEEDLVMTIFGNDDVLSFESIDIHSDVVIVQNVLAQPKVDRISGTEVLIKAVLPRLSVDTQSLKARFYAGIPFSLTVKPYEEVVQIQNGDPLEFSVHVCDEVGNLACDPKSRVSCKITGGPKITPLSVDCSSGKGKILFPSINVKAMQDTSVTLAARFELMYQKNVASVVRNVIVVPGVKPSTIQVFFREHGMEHPIKINQGEEMTCDAGKVFSGLTFKILDEGLRVLAMDDALASKVNVNWTKKTNLDEICLGNLPSIKVPQSSHESKYCQVTCGSSAEFSFTLKPRALEASSLKCKCSQSGNIVSPENPAISIVLDLQDRYGNSLIIEDIENVVVGGEGLDRSRIGKEVNKDGKLVITDLLFDDLSPGTREITIQYKDLKTHQRVKVTAGQPERIHYVNFPANQIVSMRNNYTWEDELTLQLADISGHPCKLSGVQISLKCKGNLKYVLPGKSSRMSQIAQTTNSKGQVVFKDFSVFSPLKHGEFQIIPRASVGKNEIEATPLTINLIADPNNAVRLVNKIPFKKVLAGDCLADICCSVYAEDGEIMTDIETNSITLKIWPRNKDIKISPCKTTLYYPNDPKKGDHPHHFYFRGLKAPVCSGKYFISTQYSRGSKNEEKSDLQSEMSYIYVSPRDPVKLIAEKEILTLTVTNSKDLNSRTLLKNFHLSLVDCLNNRCTDVEKGKVIVRVEQCEHPTPLLNDGKKRVEYPIVQGECHIDRLVIPEGTSGTNEQMYRLILESVLHGRDDENMEPYSLPFLFYNDAEKRVQMAHLFKEREQLVETINTYQLFLDTTKQLTKEMQRAVSQLSKQLIKARTAVKERGENLRELNNIEQIAVRTRELEDTMQLERGKPHRKCSVPPAERHALVLGKVAHLAEVEEEDVARVLSWHLASDMDCIVTLNSTKAMELHKHFNAQQQVLPLDSVYRKSLTAWDRKMPHTGLPGSRWRGNPVFARHLLKLVGDEKHCRTVFSLLLGDTLVIDDLDCANEYRRRLVKYSYCPTILTRNGERVRSNGKFGGHGNRAPHIDRMHGCVFAAPKSRKATEIQKTVEVLRRLRELMESYEKAKSELDGHILESNSLAMLKKHKQHLAAQEQLDALEKKLGLTDKTCGTPRRQPLLDNSNNNNNNKNNNCNEISSQLMMTIRREVDSSVRWNIKRRSLTPEARARSTTPVKRARSSTPTQHGRARSNTPTTKRKTSPSSYRRGARSVTPEVKPKRRRGMSTSVPDRRRSRSKTPVHSQGSPVYVSSPEKESRSPSESPSVKDRQLKRRSLSSADSPPSKRQSKPDLYSGGGRRHSSRLQHEEKHYNAHHDDEASTHRSRGKRR